MKKLKVVNIAALSMVVVSMGLTACGAKDDANKSGSAATDSPKAAAEAFPLKTPQNIKIGTVVTDGMPASKDIRLWQDIEKQSNIHVDFQDVFQSQWKEKKGLMFASNDLPEAFIGHGVFTDSELLNYGGTGALIPLEKLIDQYAPNFKKALQENPELKKQITAPDGHIYAVPSFIDDWQSVKTGNIMYANKIWLDKLGMKVPTTTDEFEKMLLAFKTQDPGGNGKDKVIPFTSNKDAGFMSILFGAFGITDHNSQDNMMHIGLKSDKVTYVPVQPEYKDAITYFNKLYSQGLIDKEVFTQDGKTTGAKIQSDPRTVGTFIGWRSTAWATKPEQRNDYVPVGPLKGPKGEQTFEQYPKGLFFRGSFAITNNTKRPELLMQWIDNVISDDNQIQMVNAGRFGDYLEKQSDGTIKVLRALAPNTNDEKLNNPSNTSRINFMTLTNSKRLVTKTPVFTEKGEYDKLFEGHFAKDVYPNVFFSKEEAQKIQTLGNDINTYANSMYAKWIIDGSIDKDWDGYVKKLNDMGLKDLLAAYQSAYDRFNGTKK
ncbi:extracellular solute-binding protein [Paenibacillus sp. LMG 31458]|uniref:Extracellular solute-binding protein n=1 Tax=Paenibacillus phytorum TaxID=2654977 RepID=A0ABX1Y3Z3_9BACL|nr:extracellular solute-binding protein [Paenibacillus phytorum]NOU75491.1 extracellular solute-binding protein [Paenibacillus phytorum]